MILDIFHLMNLIMNIINLEMITTPTMIRMAGMKKLVMETMKMMTLSIYTFLKIKKSMIIINQNRLMR